MLLLYLQAPLLDHRLFLRDFFAQAVQLRSPALVLHAPPPGALDGAQGPDLKRIAFTGKRLSANLSEAMVPNMAVTGAQRGLLSGSDAALVADAPKLLRLFDGLAVVVLSPLASDGTAFGRAVAPEAVVRAMRTALPELRVVLFSQNPMSPLGSTPVMVPDADAVGPLEQLYPEEHDTLMLARAWAPVTIASGRTLAAL